VTPAFMEFYIFWSVTQRRISNGYWHVGGE